MSSRPPGSSRHGLEVRPLRVTLIAAPDTALLGGPRSIAAEIGLRLGDAGQSVTVLGSEAVGHAVESGAGRGSLASLQRVTSVWSRFLLGPPQDVVVLLDPADAPLAPLLRSRGSSVALHVTGSIVLGHRGRGWRPTTIRGLALRGVDVLVTETRAVRDVLRDEYAVTAETIRRGTRIVTDVPTGLLRPLGLVAGGFHLAFGNGHADDRTDMMLEGYHRSDARLPLVVVGRAIRSANALQLAARDPRIRLFGDVHDQRLLDQLHAHAVSSLHGRVTGTSDPSLLRSMGAGTAVIAWRTVINRETSGTAGSYFSSAAELTRGVEEVEQYPFRFRDIGELMQERARRFHDWDVTAEQYGSLASKLSLGHRVGPPITLHRLDRSTSPVPVAFRRG